MLPKVLDKKDFEEFVNNLMNAYRVVGPVQKSNNCYDFGDIEQFAALRMDYDLALQAPKKYVFPAYETILKYSKENEKVNVEDTVEAPPTVLMGAHPCDITALSLYEKVFSTEPADKHVLARHNNLYIIGIDCFSPCDENQFCLDMNSLYVKSGYDLFLTDLGEDYLVEIGTERGKRLLARNSRAREARKDDMARLQQFRNKKRDNFEYKLPYDTQYLPDFLAESEDSLIWQAASKNCFSCGSCTLICPTCYCFDVRDNASLDASKGERTRNWDSCMITQFATVAGGENFRPTKADRLEHRLFRKGKYILERFGITGCVGCGRCIRTCVAHISILDIYKQIARS